MGNRRRTKRRAHGVTVLLSHHPEVRRLKRLHAPAFHGNRLWSSSWLLMDYLGRRGLPAGARVLELGCGWGLTGIYCAARYGAVVTAVDRDPEVFAFLGLHARVNGVEIATLRRAFSGLREADFGGQDLVVGADICFWYAMIGPLKRLLGRALRAGVGSVLIADPGRPTFEELGAYCARKWGGEVFDWKTRRPRPSQGRILRVGSRPRRAGDLPLGCGL